MESASEEGLLWKSREKQQAWPLCPSCGGRGCFDLYLSVSYNYYSREDLPAAGVLAREGNRMASASSIAGKMHLGHSSIGKKRIL